MKARMVFIVGLMLYGLAQTGFGNPSTLNDDGKCVIVADALFVADFTNDSNVSVAGVETAYTYHSNIAYVDGVYITRIACVGEASKDVGKPEAIWVAYSGDRVEAIPIKSLLYGSATRNYTSYNVNQSLPRGGLTEFCNC